MLDGVVASSSYGSEKDSDNVGPSLGSNVMLLAQVVKLLRQKFEKQKQIVCIPIN